MYYDGTKVTDIATAKGDSEFVDAVISADGSGVAYSLWNADTGETSVYLFSGKEAEKIAKDAEVTAISPNGKTVCYKKYSKDGDTYSNNYRGCFYTGGAEYVIGNFCTPFAVADGAKYVYFYREATDDSSVMYVQKKDNEDTRQKILSSDEGYNSLALNRDCTQLIYSVENRGTYLVKDGAEPQKLTSKECFPITPDNCTYAYNDKTYSAAGSNGIVTAGVKDFASDKLLWMTTQGGYVTGIFKITEDGTEAVITGSELYRVILANDFHTVYYATDAKLWSIDTDAADPEPVKLLDISEVYNWEISADSGTVYYVDQFYDFYAKKGSAKAVKIIEGNDDAAHSIRCFRGNLYLIYEGELYTSDGGKAVKIKEAGNELTDMYVYDSSLLIQNKSGDYITSVDGKKFNKLQVSSD